MNIEFWYIGKTADKYLKQGIEIYKRRLKHYTNFSEVGIPDVKRKYKPEELKQKEAEYILNNLKNEDYLILLDEKGKMFTSEEFADKIANLQIQSRKKVIFLVAGAYGADFALKERADLLLSLSSMTFSHQMIRLFFVEQLYRAFTILRNEKYHNS